MSLARVLLPILIVAMVAVVPTTAFAATASFFGPIIPEGCHCDNSAPEWGCVLQVVQNTINFAISIGVIITVLVIAYAGALWMFSSVNAHNKEMARQILLNAVIGLLIALSSWILVDFVMKTLYKNDGEFGPWNTILGDGGKVCIEPKQAPNASAPGVVGTDGVTVGGGSQQIVGDEKAVREKLAAAGIPINKAPCPVGVSYKNVAGGCTSVGGLNSATVDQVITLKGICGSFTLTGGNELGHADGGQSHTTGYKVDLTGISSCVGSKTSYFTRDGSRGSFDRYKDKCGNEYVNESVSEGSHWDITVTKNCPL